MTYIAVFCWLERMFGIENSFSLAGKGKEESGPKWLQVVDFLDKYDLQVLGNFSTAVKKPGSASKIILLILCWGELDVKCVIIQILNRCRKCWCTRVCLVGVDE